MFEDTEEEKPKYCEKCRLYMALKEDFATGRVYFQCPVCDKIEDAKREWEE